MYAWVVKMRLADDGFYERANWILKFSWLPQRCCKTGKPIWLKKGYKGTVIWTGPGDPVVESRWLEKDRFLILRLKGEF